MPSPLSRFGRPTRPRGQSKRRNLSLVLAGVASLLMAHATLAQPDDPGLSDPGLSDPGLSDAALPAAAAPAVERDLPGPTGDPGDAARASASQPVESDAPGTASASALAAATRVRDGAVSRTEQVRANLAAVKEILGIGLTNQEAGELLREARRRAPDPSAVEQRVAGQERLLAEARLERVRLLEARRTTPSQAEVARLGDALQQQVPYVAALEGALLAERELLTASTELVGLLDGQLLWIGSAPPIGPQWVRDVARGARWVGDPHGWLGVARVLIDRVAQTAVSSSLVTILLGWLVLMRVRLRRRFLVLAEPVGKYATDQFQYTARALVITLLMALPLPVALGAAGALLVSQNGDLFAAAVGDGLLASGAVALLLDFFRIMCRNNGLADKHFQWNQRARRTLFNNLHWLLMVEVPAAFVTAACDSGGAEVLRQGLGRLAFLVGSVGLTIFVARVGRPGSGVFAEMMSPDGWAWRLRRIWYGLLVLLPATLSLAAAMGYYYTATVVLSRFFSSGVIILAGIVCYSLLTRWLLVTRRRLAIQQARKRLAELREARLRKGVGDTPATATGEAVPEIELPGVDIAAASTQTLALLRTLVAAGVLVALWAVWKDVLPALAVLERVQLTRPTLDGEGAVLVEPVTLWSLLLGGFALVLTIVAARNLPAMLELAVLQRFPLDAGVRYAASTLTRYVVIAIGIVTASNLLGIEWARAQWIIAALGVGLGFGLQEIVANFVSGLIILFERPVRVGDTVTVGDVSGTVSRLQIRATTITDFDNKEVLVPNKSFITDRVVNWTLSNPTTRLLIPIGIAYGSDVPQAQRVIADAVRACPTVLQDPAPSVLFVSFGDSSLNLEVRAFVGELSKRLPTVNELHLTIDAALRHAGIEIPFPQRDLHLRSSDIGPVVPRCAGEVAA